MKKQDPRPDPDLHRKTSEIVNTYLQKTLAHCDIAPHWKHPESGRLMPYPKELGSFFKNVFPQENGGFIIELMMDQRSEANSLRVATELVHPGMVKYRRELSGVPTIEKHERADASPTYYVTFNSYEDMRRCLNTLTHNPALQIAGTQQQASYAR